MRMGSYLFAALAGALVMVAATDASAQRLQLPQDVQGSSGDFAWRLLARHNLERDRKGTERLRWSQKLAQQAQAWADRLARTNRF